MASDQNILKLEGFLKITDPNTGEVLVDKHNVQRRSQSPPRWRAIARVCDQDGRDVCGQGAFRPDAVHQPDAAQNIRYGVLSCAQLRRP